MRLVTAKEPLLKTALGRDALPIQQSDEDGGSLRFPWFDFTDDGETVAAYSQLISAICRTAQEKTRVTAKPNESCPNPRFTMRCWAISLGLVGPEFKKIRHILTHKLPGNGAFSKGFDPRTVAAQAAEGGADDE